jgi:DNA-binding transcriptional regulator YiaG
MPNDAKVKTKKTLPTMRVGSLRQACWQRGLSVTALCRQLNISRNTAYEAWEEPQRYPVAAPLIFSTLGITNGQKN